MSNSHSMFKNFATTQSAKITLVLIGWVFAICLTQNSGMLTVCEYKYASLADSTHVTDQSTDISKQCDLTEKLLGSAKVNLDHVVVSFFVALLVIVAWLVSTRQASPQFTEPIVPKSRLHLTFCVFRE
ncbi:hypothetical protein OPW41_09010 [Vibrio europaeus]|nr:hypothetical protein [Vibrio europaeus]MDC5705954.1 hypothetical protein [Vibrio europaeus]MDC5709364.1 hypothetical protein [Vibrio europaeus]MDC5713763.1 hypothetical protein [Vibrio europaeus]MDC5720483.1 hypothetical protein [Vibrio europaeus]MDC5745065.1 hypothetical protein [Vibrio europaeus]